MKIVTITLNPAFDIHCHIDHFLPYHENLAHVTERDAGGKGVNISRALTANHVENTALLVLGEENSEDFCKSLTADGIVSHNIVIPGRIRENITIHTKNADETRISFAGFSADESLLIMAEKALSVLVEEGTFVTFTGRVPDGIKIDAVKAFLNRLRACGAKIIVDSRSFEKPDLIDVKPWLIKPNQEEISHYFDRDIQSVEEAAEAAAMLHKEGIENVMISLGSQGALVVCEQGCFVATPPKIEAISTIGAGDSSIAGFLVAAANDRSPAEMLRTAVAYGSAACMQKGTRPPQSKDIADILEKIAVRKL